MRDVQIVVVDEGDAAAVDRVDRVAVNLLQMMLARIVGGMGLAREHNLHVPAVATTAGGSAAPDPGKSARAACSR